MQHVARSPYARALGTRIEQLHPVLQQYFSPLPAGAVGIGEGVFHRVGTPRRWLWPFLKPLHARGVVFAGWESEVPFRIANRFIAGRVVSKREFLLPDRTWTMRDAVSLKPHGRLVDAIGEPAAVAASFDVDVDGGALVLTSRTVGVRLGGFRMRLPRFCSPVVRLRESFDDATSRQRVAGMIDVPFIGRVYEYSGHFTYRIQEAHG